MKEYSDLVNEKLIAYFENEFKNLFNEIINSGKQDEIQAFFIEYDHYYHFTGYVICYGQQDYPLIEEPRYISNEFDYNKQVLFIDNGINFEPAWVRCEEFEDLQYLDINYELEDLFRLHSRTLLHKALDGLESNGQLVLFNNKPFTFYINEHDSEVMMLYLMN